MEQSRESRNKSTPMWSIHLYKGGKNTNGVKIIYSINDVRKTEETDAKK